ncbi:lipoprotein LpqH [Gordonia sp. PP30]|uniref:lipoprotein LpqH n=1 Tax=unclassified Gordonia (in: high G+C Gram-positive bacteria) TaxID=2657482 RepID=UPI001FFF3999|nr:MULTISPECIES: lipoprotein LpqH [unclassified Gordonia (in: high G+C Gram-positive bacteria)]UQE74803.1 lipoprotein LpqH [Gordonia sp. PP30]
MSERQVSRIRRATRIVVGTPLLIAVTAMAVGCSSGSGSDGTGSPANQHPAVTQNGPVVLLDGQTQTVYQKKYEHSTTGCDVKDGERQIDWLGYNGAGATDGASVSVTLSNSDDTVVYVGVKADSGGTYIAGSRLSSTDPLPKDLTVTRAGDRFVIEGTVQSAVDPGSRRHARVEIACDDH